MKDDRGNIRFIGALILLHGLWFCLAMVWGNLYNGDSYEYIYLAENMLKGHYYAGNPALPVVESKLTLRTPGYSLFLLLFYPFGFSNTLILLLQNGISIASCWMIREVFLKIAPGTRHSWIYLVLVAAYPAQMIFSDMLAPDILLQFFLVCYFRNLVFFLDRPALKQMILMSLWLIAAVLTKPIVYPFLGLHFIFALGYGFRFRKSAWSIVAVIPLLVMLSYGSWNKSRTGFYHISSVQSVNMLEYNVRLFLVSAYGQAYADSVLKQEKKTITALPRLRERYAYASQKANTLIKDHFIAYTFFHLRESLRFFVEPGKGELDLFTGWLSYRFERKGNVRDSYRDHGLKGVWHYLEGYPWLPLILMTGLFNLLRIVGFLLFCFHKQIPLVLRLATCIYIAYFALLTGPVANTRYFLPVLLVMSGCACLGYASRWQPLNHRNVPK